MPHAKQNASGASSPVRAASPSISGTTANTNKSQNPLINMESSSKVALPKETLIDEDEKVPEEPVKKSEVKSVKNTTSAEPEKETKQNDEIIEEKPEVIETPAKEDEKEEEEKEQEKEHDNEEAPEDEQNEDAKPLTKTQKKNQNKKAKKQQQKQKQNETNDEEEVAEDLNDVAL